jgi:glycine cleavage system H lipoate-binding protein
VGSSSRSTASSAEGWICVIELADAGELDAMLDAGAYQQLVQE